MDYSLRDKFRREDFSKQELPTMLRETGTNQRELLENLQKNYEERLSHLLSQLKEIYLKVDQDEILLQMKENAVSEEYRKQRAEEIISEMVSMEQEAIISKMYQINAVLKTQIKQLEETRGDVELNQNEELMGMKKQFFEMESAAEKEATLRKFLESENEKLNNKIKQMNAHHQEILKIKETQLGQQSQLFESEIKSLKKELEEVTQRYNQVEKLLTSNARNFEESMAEMDAMRNEYANMESEYNALNEELERKMEERRDILSQVEGYEKELEEMKRITSAQEEELKSFHQQLKQSEREKIELEKCLESQKEEFRNAFDKEQRAGDDSVKNVKDKYKRKIGNLKKKCTEMKTVHESINNEMRDIKRERDDLELNLEKVLSSSQNDMRLIKAEWEKKCQEIELGCQRMLAEAKAKHQSEINKIQAEYQGLLDRKMMELQSEAATHIAKNRTIDLELKNHLENKVAQLESDYILKSTHEALMLQEVTRLKQSHQRELNELIGKHEGYLEERVREITDKRSYEFDHRNDALKRQAAKLEEQVDDLKEELVRQSSKLKGESEENASLKRENEDLQNAYQNVLGNLNEAHDTIGNMNQFLSEEGLKRKELEREITENKRLKEQMGRKLMEENQILERRIKELLMFQDASQGLERTNEEYSKKLITIQREKENLSTLVESLERKNKDLNSRLQNVTEKHNKDSEAALLAAQSIRREGNERFDREIEEHQRTKAKLAKTEIKLRDLELETNQANDKSKEFKERAAKAEAQSQRERDEISHLEAELSRREGNRKELARKVERMNNKLLYTQEKVRKIMSIRLNYLRNDLMALGSAAQGELNSFKKLQYNCVNELVKVMHKEKMHFADRMKEQEYALMEEMKNEIQKLERRAEEASERDRGEFNEKLKSYADEIEALARENIELRKELDIAARRRKETDDELKRTKLENEKVAKEFVQKERELNAFLGEFGDISKFVSSEIRRIKQDSNLIIKEIRKQEAVKRKGELKTCIQIIETHKKAHEQSNANLLKQVGELANRYSDELRQVVNHCEGIINFLEMESSKGEELVQRKNLEIEKLSEEIQLLQQNYMVLQSENQTAIEHFEEKISHFKDIMKKDNWSLENLKKDTSSELETLKKDNRQLKGEINRRDKMISQLKVELEEGKDELKTLRASQNCAILPVQERTLGWRPQNRFDEKKYEGKEKELMELKSLLAKSYERLTSNSSSHSLTGPSGYSKPKRGNMNKLANQSERDIDEINARSNNIKGKAMSGRVKFDDYEGKDSYY